MAIPSVVSNRDRMLWWLVFAAGLCLSLLMAYRSQLGGDQRLMLDLGWRLAAQGEWLQYGMPTSAGGRSPGGFMSLLMALPLYLWRDYRAPAFFLLTLHAAAFLLLAQCLRPALTRRGQWLLLLLVWFNPWRMYFSAHIWNANFMFVAAVLHLASSQRMSAHREAWCTCLQVLLIALAMQVHTSAAVLAVLSLLLLWKKLIKVHWGGFAAGVVLGIAAYIPWLVTVTHDPSLTPGDKGFLLRGLVYVFPLVRGLLYWLKISTLTVASDMRDFDFTLMVGASINAWLAPLGAAIGILAHVTLAPSAWANWRFLRKMWPLTRWRQHGADHPRAWLRGYTLLSFAAAIFSFAISPTTIMFWQVFVSLPAAALVLLMAIEALLRTRLNSKVIVSIRIWGALAVMLLIFQALAAPLYRCGGRPADPQNAMLIDLKVPVGCQ